MTKPIKWGILGTGRIAHSFAEGLHAVNDAELAAVGSRSKSTADAFAARFNIPRCHSSYQSLAEDPEVDVVYVSTPHPLHCENTLLCLNAGKAVLCEKPFAVNSVDAEIMIQCAKDNGLFLMEAMWTRFLPAIVQVRHWLEEGAIGDVRMMLADFGFRAKFDPQGRLFNPSLGGGALLDIGVYVVSLASMIFGKQPSILTALSDIGMTGVDEQTTMAFRYDTGALAALTCSIRTLTNQEVSFLGTRGKIRIHSPFWNSHAATMTDVEGKTVYVEPDRVGNGYNYEAAEVNSCLRGGKLESSTIPLSETLAIMQTLDSIRTEVDLKYPTEA